MQTLIPVSENHFKPLQSFFQTQRAKNCTTTSCSTWRTRKAPLCDGHWPPQGSSPAGKTIGADREKLLLTIWQNCRVVTCASRRWWRAIQKKFNDLCLSNGFQNLGWKELITAETCIGSLIAANTDGISRDSKRIRSRTISYLKCMYYGNNLFNVTVRLLFLVCSHYKEMPCKRHSLSDLLQILFKTWTKKRWSAGGDCWFCHLVTAVDDSSALKDCQTAEGNLLYL